MSTAQINVKFKADLKEFSTKMQNAERSLKRMGRKLQKVGTNLSVGVTAPLVAMGYAAVKNFDKQAKALAQVEAGLKSTGNQVGYTSKQLQKMAADLQRKTLFGDEEILKDATAQLLTFTNIAGDQFERTQIAALDLATRIDGDLKSASIKLGKALNDPVANLSALSISGIQFSTEQKATIKALAETNRLADAQTLILDELEKQYGGSAAAAAKAGLGPFKQLKNSISDLTEEFGKIISEALSPVVVYIDGVVEKFKSLDESTKRTIVKIAALVVALGPLTLTIGYLMTNVVPGLIAAFGFLKSATIAASTAIKGFNIAILANPVTILIAGVVLLTERFTAMVQKITPLVSKLKTFFNLIKSAGNYAQFVSLQIRDQVDAMAEQDKQAKTNNTTQTQSNKLLSEYLKTLEKIKNVGTDGSRSIATALSGTSTGITTLASSGAVGTNLTATQTVGEIESQIEATQRLQQQMQNLSVVAQEAGNAVGDAFGIMGENIVDSLGLADKGFQGFLKSLFKTVTKLISMLLANAMANAIAGASQSATATGPAAVFTLPAFIATAVGGIVSAFAALPKFETGGVVDGSSYFGDKILARLNSGELILNTKQQERLYNMMQPVTSVQVNLGGGFELDGQKLRLVLNRTDSYNNRVG